MSLDLFQTFLLPVTENGKIQFHQKPTAAHPAGRILKADFSRPNIGATSGALGFQEDGKYVEYAEDQPDWSFENGCPELKMRRQAQNLLKILPDINLGGRSSTSLEPGTGIFEGRSICRFTTNPGFNNSTARWNLSGLSSPQKFFMHLYYRSLSSFQDIRVDVGDRGSQTFSDVESDGEWHLFTAVLEHDNGWPVGQFFDIDIQGLSSGDSIDVAICLVLGDNNNDFIPPSPTGSFSRAANSFLFSDLILNGVTGNTGNCFSFLLNPEFSNSYANSGIRVQFADNSQAKFSIFGMGNGGYRIFSHIENSYVSFTNPVDEKILFTVHGDSLKVYHPSVGFFINHTFSQNDLQINRMHFSSNNGLINLGGGQLCLAPNEFTESEALAALNQL